MYVLVWYKATSASFQLRIPLGLGREPSVVVFFLDFS